MSKYSKEHEKEFIGKIRKILVHHPGATILNIQKILDSNGIRLDKDYINKLLRKIRYERAYRYNNRAIQEAIAEYEDFVLYASGELMKMSQNTTNDMVKLAILNSLINQRRNLLKIQFEVGVFDKPSDNGDISIVQILKNLEEKKI
jgi:hypothetical protein